MYAFRLNINEICMYSLARAARVQLTVCRVVTESKANCILDLVIESYYYGKGARYDWHRTLLMWILHK